MQFLIGFLMTSRVYFCFNKFVMWPRIWLARMTSRFSERVAVGQQGRFLTELCGNHFLNHRLGLKAG